MKKADYPEIIKISRRIRAMGEMLRKWKPETVQSARKATVEIGLLLQEMSERIDGIVEELKSRRD